MPVEVTASFVRGSVFIAGEQVECQIQFTNTDKQANAEMLAWASAQILCQCTVNESRLKRLAGHTPGSTDSPLVPGTSANGETSFVPNRGEEGFTVLANKPAILFCNLLLRPGETKLCTYRDALPLDAPPTYRGQTIKYAYKVVVGIQKLSRPTQLLRLSLRVLSVPGMTEALIYQMAGARESEDRGVSGPLITPTNPFTDLISGDNGSDCVLETALHLLSCITGPKQLNNYNISNARGSVVRFSLFKTSFKLGDDIVGMFDFQSASVPCLQCTVTLQSEEKVPSRTSRDDHSASLTTSYTQVNLSTLNTAQCPLSLHIPPPLTPGFETTLISLSWRLHFEFVTLTSSIPPASSSPPPDQAYTWSPPDSVESESLIWHLAIQILPTNPATLSGHTQSNLVTLTC